MTYDGTKRFLKPLLPNHDHVSQMIAASIGEVAACSVRVPVEVIKQRTQANVGRSSWYNLIKTLETSGVRGLYRGYTTTIFREIPFSFIQFPLWEFLKKKTLESKGKPKIDPWESMMCGSVAGGFSAFVTTPLDVAKTRVMLADSQSSLASGNLLHALKSIWRQNCLKGLFAGCVPRVTWISVGGAIFLGGYDMSSQLLKSFLQE